MRSHSTDPDRVWQLLALFVVAVALIVTGLMP